MSLILFNLFLFASLQHGLPDRLLSSLCYVESKHDVSAYHEDDGKGNSVGICQVKLSTARMLGFKGTEKQLMVPQTNIVYAARYLRHQMDRYDGNITYAIISYNQGSRKSLTKTNYSCKVIKRWQYETKNFAR